jgi:hypothetical protein
MEADPEALNAMRDEQEEFERAREAEFDLHRPVYTKLPQQCSNYWIQQPANENSSRNQEGGSGMTQCHRVCGSERWPLGESVFEVWAYPNVTKGVFDDRNDNYR